MLTIVCPNDGEIYHADEQHAGRSIKCKKCGRLLPIAAKRPQVLSANGEPAPLPQEEPEEPPSTKRLYVVIAVAAVALVVVVGLILMMRHPSSAPDRATGGANAVAVATPPAQEALPKASDHRLKNGSEISERDGAAGNGSLELKNGSPYDGAAILIDETSGFLRGFIYVTGGDSATMRSIRPCKCRLYFEQGSDWDKEERHFRRPAGYAVFEQTLPFEENEVDVPSLNLTLQPDPSASVKITRLSQEEYNRRVGKR